MVAADVSTDEDFRGELRRLSTSFGIGIIQLDIEDPDSSEVLVPARQRDGLDWDALNKLATMNEDVKRLLTRIKNDLTTNEIKEDFYDSVPDREQLIRTHKKVGS